MQHLNDEQFARLVDEEPTDDEATHLTLCPACVTEMDAMQAQTRALAELPELTPSPALQRRLHRGLAVEGLFLSTHSRRKSLLRIAAALALFASGSLTGFVGRGATGSDGTLAVERTPPATVSEAADQLQAAEAAYTAALTAYAAKSGGPPASDPVNRLAALEGIVLISRAALNEAPADPVINGYHLTALEQRDAILRQIEESPAQSEDTEQEWY